MLAALRGTGELSVTFWVSAVFMPWSFHVTVNVPRSGVGAPVVTKPAMSSYTPPVIVDTADWPSAWLPA